jgi:hypothetical protein
MLSKCLAIAAKYQLVPFYVLASEYNPAPADKGLISTRFPLSILPSEFDQFMAQAGIKEQPRIELHHLGLEPQPTESLESTYERALTRMLLHYLLQNCMVSEEQARRVLEHTATRRNFAQLIGCPRHEAGYRPTRVQDDYEEGSLPGAGKVCVEYYGYLMRVELIVACRSLNVSRAVLLDVLGITEATLAEQSGRFRRSKKRGYEPPEKRGQRPEKHRPGGSNEPRKREEKQAAKRTWVESEQPRRPESRPPVSKKEFEDNELAYLSKNLHEPTYDLMPARDSLFEAKPVLQAGSFLMPRQVIETPAEESATTATRDPKDDQVL